MSIYIFSITIYMYKSHSVMPWRVQKKLGQRKHFHHLKDSAHQVGLGWREVVATGAATDLPKLLASFRPQKEEERVDHA